MKASSESLLLQRLSPYLERYGELVFDFAWTMTEDIAIAQQLMRETFKALAQDKETPNYERYERPYVMRMLYTRMRRVFQNLKNPEASEIKYKLDALTNAEERLDQLPYYLKRLDPEDRFILLLREKYGFNYGEIASVVDQPEGTIKLRRQYALKILENWIWEGA